MKVKILIKKVLYWALAFLITIGAAIYQRITGPTHPLDIKFSVNEEIYKISLPRSHAGETDCPVEITLPEQFTGEIVYRRFPTNETWDTIQLLRVNKNLLAFLPQQPPAGKLEYQINLNAKDTEIDLGLEESIVIRFRGSVPAWVLMPHVLFMFLAMFWSNATGIQAAANIKSFRRNGLITVILFAIGGLILGPIVQKYAFGAYWTGWPMGEDLTDNKVLVSFIIWTIALVLNRKKDRRWMIMAAAIILFVIYMIPHSMRGSELDIETGEIITGAAIFLIIQLKSIKLKPVCTSGPL